MKYRFAVLLVASAVRVMATPLPFVETFEASDGVTNGSLHAQNGWVLDSGTADVQASVVQNGLQAMELRDGAVSRELSSDGSSMWLNFQVRCSAAPAVMPTSPAANTSLAFFIGTNLNLVVYSNTVPVELATSIQTNAWVRFDVYCDYAGGYWNLAVDGASVASGLPLYSANQVLGSVVFENAGSDSVFVDQFDVVDVEDTADVPDTDGDNIPDWWEQKHCGSATNCPAESPSGNPGYSYLDTYIAGLNPVAPDPLLVSSVEGGNGLRWNPVPSRQYSVYWTDNLTNGFAWVQTLDYPQDEFIDLAHGSDSAGFYRLEVGVQ